MHYVRTRGFDTIFLKAVGNVAIFGLLSAAEAGMSSITLVSCSNTTLEADLSETEFALSSIDLLGLDGNIRDAYCAMAAAIELEIARDSAASVLTIEGFLVNEDLNWVYKLMRNRTLLSWAANLL